MPDPLADRPFAWSQRGQDVVVTHRGRQATVLRNEAAAHFLVQVSGLDGGSAQQLMARVTGNFKRGNERRDRASR
jgi:hypothetical protein